LANLVLGIVGLCEAKQAKLFLLAFATLLSTAIHLSGAETASITPAWTKYLKIPSLVPNPPNPSQPIYDLRAVGIGVDSSGNCYIAGGGWASADSITLDGSRLASPPESPKRSNSYLAKFDPDGKVLWAKAIPNRLDIALPWFMDVDSDGYSYIAYRDSYADGLATSFRVTQFSPDGQELWTEKATNGINPGTVMIYTHPVRVNSQTVVVSVGDSIAWLDSNGAVVRTVLIQARDFQLDGFGKVVAVGVFTNSLSIQGKTIMALGKQDLALARFEPNGDLLSLVGFGAPDAQLYPEKLGVLSDESVLCVGFSSGAPAFPHVPAWSE